jgi:hypothetical protein
MMTRHRSSCDAGFGSLISLLIVIESVPEGRSPAYSRLVGSSSHQSRETWKQSDYQRQKNKNDGTQNYDRD